MLCKGKHLISPVVLGLVAALVCSPRAYASTVPGSAKVADPPCVLGTGLNGAYWDAGPFMSIATAIAYASGHTPTATFLSSKVDYPNGAAHVTPDTTTLAAFLGADAGSLSGHGSDIVETSIFRFTGFVNILDAFDLNPAAPGIDVTFRVGSDDGFRLVIGGHTVTEFSGERPFGYSYGVARFNSAGLYPLNLTYFENFGETGVEFRWSTFRQINQPMDSRRLYRTIPPACDPAPEPATLALLGTGALGLLGKLRRRAE